MWSAAILAGGKATRLHGRDKSALVLGGEPILTRQLRELAQVTGDIMIVGGNPPRERIGTARIVTDRVPESGPLGGLHAALAEALGSALVLVACDMPNICAPFLSHLLTLTCEADIVVPKTAHGYHPLCAAYARACLEPVSRRLADNRLKMTGLFDDVRVRIVGVEEIGAFGDPDQLLTNVNTPDEYLELESLHGHKL
ncbi:MAG TPA: molybdenum cofactor guanylyltransferase [Vicinamibacterales bacterium]